MKISVIVTSFNQKHYLVQAIESVINQTFKPFEIIVADNHSVDGSVDLIQAYVDRFPGRIVGLFREERVALPKNKNEALEMVRGDLVTILDGDDRFLPRKLELEMETYQNHPEARIVHSNFFFIDESGRRTGTWLAENQTPPTRDVFREAFAGSDIYRNELVATECFEEVGVFDEELQIYEDWDMQIRLTKRFMTAYCPHPLVEYRLHSQGISRSAGSLHLMLMKKVHAKNAHLLHDLNQDDRVFVEKELSKIFAATAQRAAWEAMDGQDRRLAFGYLREALQYNPRALNPALLARAALPTRAYMALRRVYHSGAR